VTTIGLAMIARNAAETMRRALDPFAGKIDEVAIVLGGNSTDATAEIAKGYGAVYPYDGELDDNGALLDFASARQQANDHLATDWAVVVDSDDIWAGVEHLRGAVDRAEQIGASLVYLPYWRKNTYLLQPRIYRRDSGKWVSPIHEYWSLDDKRARVTQTDQLTVTQERPESVVSGRQHQNIDIAERWLGAYGPNARTLALLCQDYLVAGYLEKVVSTGGRYLALGKPNSDDELHQVYFWRGVANLHLNKPHQAAEDATAALLARNYSPGWTLLADAMLQKAQGVKNPVVFLEMALMYAEKALSLGKPKTMFPYNPAHVASAPLLIKARALGMLGRLPEAIAALDLAEMIGGDDGQAKQVRQEITYAKIG